MHNLPVFAEEKPKIFTLDGGTGTELERNGAIMSQKCWSGLAGWENPKILEDVHRSFVDAGAEIIIANTFATSPIAQSTSVDPETIQLVNQDACRIAMKVKHEANRPIAVAGSISHMVPFFEYDGKKICGRTPESVTEEVYIAGIKQQVQIFEENDLDVIFVEEQYEPDRTEWDLMATMDSKLPVFVGIACKDVDGQMCTKKHDVAYPLEDLLDVILPYRGNIAAIGIMHTPASIVEKCLEIIKSKWDSSIFCYAEIGEYNPPNWTCVRLEEEVWATYVRTWAEQGCCMIGGCCGVMPDDIKVVKAIVDQINERKEEETKNLLNQVDPPTNSY